MCDLFSMSQVLRHEEFEEGCKATCNGPYDGKWSKTMIGYGSEDIHFVVELTYNYGVGEYRLGNDFLGITLRSSQAVANARKLKWPLSEVSSGLFEAIAPGGYKFYLEDQDQPKTDPVQKVTLAVSDLQKSIAYWSGLLGMKMYNKDETKKKALLGYADNQDGHEICFVGDEAFEELSQTDPNADNLIDNAMVADKSEEWFAKHKRQKPSA
ncbi:hypothetical protein FKM82_008648 [Ascaphus truei]